MEGGERNGGKEEKWREERGMKGGERNSGREEGRWVRGKLSIINPPSSGVLIDESVHQGCEKLEVGTVLRLSRK